MCCAFVQRLHIATHRPCRRRAADRIQRAEVGERVVVGVIGPAYFISRSADIRRPPPPTVFANDNAWVQLRIQTRHHGDLCAPAGQHNGAAIGNAADTRRVWVQINAGQGGFAA